MLGLDITSIQHQEFRIILNLGEEMILLFFISNMVTNMKETNLDLSHVGKTNYPKVDGSGNWNAYEANLRPSVLECLT